MPDRPGEQRRIANAIPNPFDEAPTRINEYTAQQIATLQSRLDRQLGPEYISTRPGAGGGKVHYLAAEKVINLANEVFGFNGWSSSIRDVQIDFVDENPSTGKISLGLSIIVRVSLKDGTYHEDIGYGQIENSRSKAAAFEKAKKEAATDALKRALRNFGNLLGNCLYDKDYLQRVNKIKVKPSKWDPENLHRHPDFAPTKKEPITEAPPVNTTVDVPVQLAKASNVQPTVVNSSDFEDEFDGNLFDEVDFAHPDEVVLHDTSMHEDGSGQTEITPSNIAPPVQNRPPAQAMQPGSGARGPNGMQPPQHQGPQQPYQRPGPPPRPPQTPQPNQNMRPNPAHNRPNPPQHVMNQSHRPPQQNQNQMNQRPPSRTNFVPPTDNNNQAQQHANHAPSNDMPSGFEPQIGFVTSRAAEMLKQADVNPANIPAFNPHAESPSLRRTSGVEHNKSTPIFRHVITGSAGATTHPPATPTAAASNKTNFVNPAADANRRIGMPGGAQSPYRGSYKPPGPAGVKRVIEPPGRPPLADLSNKLETEGGTNVADAKRAKTEV